MRRSGWTTALAGAIWCWVSSAGANTIPVDTTTDSGTGNCTLREAIAAANTDAVVDGCSAGSGTDLIDLSALSGTIDVGPTGYAITSSLTIAGPGARLLRISGANNAGQTIRTDGAVDVTIQDVTIADTQGTGGFANCITPCGDSMTLRRVRVTNCVNTDGMFPAFGGALASNCTSDLTIVDSTFDDNHAVGIAADGGAINWGARALRIVNSTFSHNSAGKRGGAVLMGGGGTPPVLENVTFFDNGAAASGGGAIASFGHTVIHDTVVAGSTAGGNCYLYVYDPTFGPSLRAAPDGGWISGDYNLSDDDTCDLAANGTGNQENVAAQLGALTDNGGPTDTHDPADGSPLVASGDPAGCLDAAGMPLLADQRGSARPVGPRCDIGAVEHDVDLQTTTTTTSTTSSSTTTLPPGTPLAGTRLQLTGRPRDGVARALSLLANAPAIDASADPLTGGGTLRIASGNGFDTTIALPASAWRRLGKPSKPKGFVLRRTDAVRLLLVKPGKVLKLLAGGSGIAVPLATTPDPVDVTLTLGSERYCLRFGGTPKFKAGARFVSKAAAAPASCP